MAIDLPSYMTEKDYERFAQKLLEFSSTKRLIEYLIAQYNDCKDDNPKFWPYLFEGFQKVRTAKFYHGDEEESIRSRIDGITELKSVKEKEVYINKVLSDKIEEFKKAKKSEKLKLEHLPIIEERLSKLRSQSALKKRFYKLEIFILTKSLLRIAYEGDFNTEDITDLSPDDKAKVLKMLLKYYFTTENTKNENRDAVLKLENEKGQFIYYNKIIPTKRSKNSINVFQRAYKCHSARKIAGRSLFKGFQNFEKDRFRAVSKCFDVSDDEHVLVSNYLYSIGKLTEKEMDQHLGSTNSFGIDRQLHFETITEILDELTDAVDFIYFDGKNKFEKKRIINDAATVLTTNDYTKENIEVKFRCETTTAAYILGALNEKFSIGHKLNAYSIDNSKLFFIPLYKKPSDREFIKESEFNRLKRDNFSKSKERFLEFSKNNSKIEHQHLKILRSIFARYHF